MCCLTHLLRVLIVGQVIVRLRRRVELLHRLLRELHLEEIALVEEEDHRRLLEPLRVDDLVEEGDSLVHAVLCLVLEEHL